MALTITGLDTFKDSVDRTVYNTTLSVAYDTAKEYLIAIVGEDVVALQGINALGEPLTTGVTWTMIPNAELIVGRMGMRVYKGVCTSSSSQTTQITFVGDQRNCNAGISETTDVDSITGVTTDSEVTSKTISITIPTVTAGSAAIAFFGSESSGVWSASVGETAILSTVDTVGIFGSYNLNEDEIMAATYVDDTSPASEYMLAIGFELKIAVAAGTPIITSVNGGSTIADGDSVTYAGTDFALSGNMVVISPTDNIADPAATQITPDTEGSTTAIVITVALPTGSTSADPVYTFVDDGSLVSASFSVSVTPVVAPTLFTALFEEATPTVEVAATALSAGLRYEIKVPGDTDFTLVGAADSAIGTRFNASGAAIGTGTTYLVDPVICESTDFANGVTATIDRGGLGTTIETATDVTAISSLPTATPQYWCTFTNGDPVDGDSDEVVFAYDGTGDIRSVVGGRVLPVTSFTGVTCT